MDTRAELINILVNKLKLNVDPGELHAELSLESMGMNSMLLVQFLYLLEDDYDISISTEEILEVSTFGDLVGILDHKMSAKN